LVEENPGACSGVFAFGDTSVIARRRSRRGNPFSKLKCGLLRHVVPRNDDMDEMANIIRQHEPMLYIMASAQNGTLYTGVTSDLSQRASQHREGLVSSFTKRYGCKSLVYFETYEIMGDAIGREKQIKAGSRRDKILGAGIDKV
jgi:putative endonuclease